ncbi:MAG: LCP family protein [Oscillospiraceae bacterium]|nr:LCP family protein [Candidatus Equicaccousia limihippi]
MQDNFDFSSLQKNNKAKKKRKTIRKVVNIIASIVLAISVLVTGAMASYIYGLSNVTLNDQNAGVSDANIVTSNHSGVSYILVVGICPPEEGGKLTDTIVVACLDHNKKTLNFLQIPRDLYIGDEDGSPYSGGKINAAYASPRDGETNINCLRRVINNHLGIPLDHYAIVTIPSFIKLIDALGGLTINITQENGIDIRDYADGVHSRVGPGWVTLKGSKAIGFVRKRTGVKDGYLLGDADRVKYQRLAYVALAKKLKQMSVSQITSIAQSVYGETDPDSKIQTDININDLLGYALEVKGMDMNNIGIYAVPGQYSGYTVNGFRSSVYCIHKSEYVDLYNEHFNPYGKTLTTDDIQAFELYRENGEKYDGSDDVGGGTLTEIGDKFKQ